MSKAQLRQVSHCNAGYGLIATLDSDSESLRRLERSS